MVCAFRKKLTSREQLAVYDLVREMRGNHSSKIVGGCY